MSQERDLFKSMLAAYGETVESIGYRPGRKKPEFVPRDPEAVALSPHDGHRERLRERFADDGVLRMTDHELLELLIGYSIPRKDVNPLAHRILANFGDLHHVLNAKEEALREIEGLGDYTVFLLQLARGIVSRYSQQYPVSNRFLDDPEQLADFFTRKFIGMTEECVFAAFFNGRMQLLDSGLQYVGAAGAVEAHAAGIIRRAHLTGAERIILAHNHFTNPVPSLQDLTATTAMLDVLEPAGLRLMDHIIVCGDVIHSMAASGHLGLILEKRRAREKERKELERR